MRQSGGPLASDVGGRQTLGISAPAFSRLSGSLSDIPCCAGNASRGVWRMSSLMGRPTVLSSCIWCPRVATSGPALFFYLLPLSRISHHEARLLSDPLVRRSRQLQCHWRRIISLVADGLEVASGNCFSDELLAQVISIILESCRLFSPACSNLARGGGRRLARTSCAGDYSSRSFSQVGWAASVYRRQPCSRGGANRVLSPVPAGTRHSTGSLPPAPRNSKSQSAVISAVRSGLRTRGSLRSLISQFVTMRVDEVEHDAGSHHADV